MKSINQSLIQECERGNEKKIIELIDNGADVNVKDENGNTPLILLCKNRSVTVDTMKYLVDKGADIYRKNNKRDNPLTIACHMGDRQMINLLLKNKEKIKNVYDSLGLSVLNILCKKNKGRFIISIEKLIKKGADVNGKDENGMTPLLMACYFPNDTVVNHLVKQRKVNVNITNKDGDSPIMIAGYFNNLNIIKILNEHHADLSLKNKNGDTFSTIINRIGNEEIKEYFKTINTGKYMNNKLTL